MHLNFIGLEYKYSIEVDIRFLISQILGVHLLQYEYNIFLFEFADFRKN